MIIHVSYFFGGDIVFKSENIILGIDASRIRSGGAVAHLLGILIHFDACDSKIQTIHIWSYPALLARLPDFPWLIKHPQRVLEKALLIQLLWQIFVLPRSLRRTSCDIAFAIDASTLCFFKPQVVLSQDLLSYEPGVISSFGFGLSRLRLILILFVQNLAFKRASGVIFLTHYASKLIQTFTGPLDNFINIPHGVDANFFKLSRGDKNFSKIFVSPITCVYVSNTDLYKNQWVVVEAVSILRNLGYDLQLILVGGGSGLAQNMLDNAIAHFDPSKQFVTQLPFISHDDIPAILDKADLFVFASSCENMPITLMEAMASGLPIACSISGPMPEVLEDGGVYFDPKCANSISEAIHEIVLSQELRLRIQSRALDISGRYKWSSCSRDTFAFIEKTFLDLNHD